MATVLMISQLAVMAVLAGAPPAGAEDNGVGLAPAMGWSSWSFIRHDPTAADIEAQALAMHDSGLQAVGYQYINIDDFWYECPGSQGPNVGPDGFWVTDPTKFPAGPNGENGIAVVADYVHSLGLKFGLYVTPGISKQAASQAIPIAGTDETTEQIANAGAPEHNYNCGGMVGFDSQPDASVPGGEVLVPAAQQFLDNWADELESWGVDYVKLDGVGSFDIPDVIGWSEALQQTGRPIHLELSNSLNINDASVWEQYANGWRTGGDIECYCGSGGASYPLTDWSSVESRFNQVAEWQPYGEPGAFNDYDSIEVGNGANDGLTLVQRETQLSLWALASSPLILGTDLTNLDPTDLGLLKNRPVVAMDQDGIDAARIAETSTSQIFAKTEKNGDVYVGIFNTGGSPQVLTTTAATLGLSSSSAYELDNLWTHERTETAGVIEANVPSDGVALFQVSPVSDANLFPPSVTLDVNAPAELSAETPTPVTASLTNNGVQTVSVARVGLVASSGWTVTPHVANLGRVAGGQTGSATFEVTAPSPGQLFGTGELTATATDMWPAPLGLLHGPARPAHNGVLPAQQSPCARSGPGPFGIPWLHGTQCTSLVLSETVAAPVEAPYKTYSSATDAGAVFAESGDEFGISGAGADVYSGADDYSTIYLPGSMGLTSTAVTEVTSQEAMSGYAKAGIIVRNDMTAANTAPEGVILFESPEGGIQMEWDNNGGEYIDTFTPSCSTGCSAAPNGAVPESLPIYLMLQRTGGDVYTGYYSYDGANWLEVGSATVPDQAGTQDAGMFVTSHATGQPGTVTFNGFSVTSSAAPPSMATLYMANAAGFGSGARLGGCGTCYYGEDYVGYVGSGGTSTFDDVTAPSDGSYELTIIYCDGTGVAGTPGRPGYIVVDGGTPQPLQFTSTGSFSAVGSMTLAVTLQAGLNTIEFEDASAYMPNIDAIVIGIPSAVEPPYASFSSASDAVPQFRQQGAEFGISGAGAGVYSGDDNYSTIYSPASMALTSTAVVEVLSQEDLVNYGKAGIIVRNEMTDAESTSSPEGVILFESPSGGLQMEWDNNGGEYIDDVSPPNGTIPDPLTSSTPSPVYLMLQRTNGDVYTGYYSLDGTTWTEVASETVPDQVNGPQDAGMFMTSGAKGDPATVDFQNFSVGQSA